MNINGPGVPTEEVTSGRDEPAGFANLIAKGDPFWKHFSEDELHDAGLRPAQVIQVISQLLDDIVTVRGPSVVLSRTRAAVGCRRDKRQANLKYQNQDKTNS